MGESHRPDRGGSPPLPAAASAYLATLSGPEQRNTQRAYRSTLRALTAAFAPPGTHFPLTGLDDEENVERLTTWFAHQWSGRAAATFNRHLDALRSAVTFWMDQGWLTADPTRRLRRRGRAPGRTRALSVADIEALLELDAPLRERTLWTMLYETAARAVEVLGLDIEDLDRRDRRARVTRRGSAVDVIVWQTRTARLLSKLLAGRSKGPVFLTERRARVPLAAGDLDPVSGRARLSYRRAEEIFNELTKPLARPDITAPAELAAAPGWTLHDLRNSALTHAAENGAHTGTLLAYSGHASVAGLARYTRVSSDALTRWQERRDPHRRA
ncbi:site-specific integrase [Nonomuraea sp. NPDC049709]|uniref:tyrosine-type recombinase/integrase n=1 Tax=Nonomuraea sp. NPDC049709 TaxID=3154736 RepID=UPI0034410E7E